MRKMKLLLLVEYTETNVIKFWSYRMAPLKVSKVDLASKPSHRDFFPYFLS